MFNKIAVDEEINTLLNEFRTRNPYLIAKRKGVEIHDKPLGNIHGFYVKASGKQIIILNKDLEPHMHLFSCCHELGHAILHEDVNTPKLSEKTLVPELLIEAEAKYFATKLIMDFSHEEYTIDNVYTLCNYYGLPHQMDKYIRMILRERYNGGIRKVH